MSAPLSTAAKAFVTNAAWDEVKWASPSAGSWPADTVVAPPAPASAAAASPQSDWHTVHEMEAPELAALLLFHDGDPPTEHIGAVCARIEKLTSQKAPGKLAQRRVHISDWVLKNAPPSSRGVRRTSETAEAASPARGTVMPPPPSLPPTPPVQLPLASSLLPGSSGGTPAAGAPGREASAEELALAQRVGALRDSHGRLHVPAEQLPTILSAVLEVTGRLKSPPSLSARRRMIEDWYVSVSARLGGEETPHSGGDGTPTYQAAAPNALGFGPSAVPPSPAAALPAFGTRRSLAATLSDGMSGGMCGGVASAAGAPRPGGGDADELFGRLAALDAARPQSAEMRELGNLGRRCMIDEDELDGTAAQLAVLSGAQPAGGSTEELADFVSDWYRWQVHLRRGAAAGRHPAPTAAPPRPRVPPLPASLVAPTYHEPSPGARPMTAPPLSSRDELRSTPTASLSASLTSRSGIEDAEDMTPAEVMAELAASVHPAEAAHFYAAAVAGSHCEVNLTLNPTRLAALGKQVEQLSGKRVPHLMKQKRDYIVSWWRLAVARQAHSDAVNSPAGIAAPAHGAATVLSPSRRADANPVRAFDPGTPRSAIQKLLGEYGAPDKGSEGAYELRVPVEHLQIICSQAEQLTGQKAPRQPRARREWLAALASQG